MPTPRPSSSRAALLGAAAAGALGALCVQNAIACWRSRRRRSEPGFASAGLWVGADVGGTTISVGLVNDTGTLVGEVQHEPLGDDHDVGKVIPRVASLVLKALQSAGRKLHEVSGVGICTPGLLDFDRGIVLTAANLRGWRNVKLTQLLAQELGMPPETVVLEHDANTALLAEVWTGAAKGCSDVVLLTLGTGIGAGVLCGGQLLRGSKGMAGEVGHAILVPDGRRHGSAGVDGIWEAYASASAVAARATEATSSIASEVGRLVGRKSAAPPVEPWTCERVFRQAAVGDAFAAGLVDETAKYLAIGCINCSRYFDPEVILFTGGMALAGEQLLSKVREYYKRYHWTIMEPHVEMRIAASAAHAGLVGAAFAARSKLRKER